MNNNASKQGHPPSNRKEFVTAWHGVIKGPMATFRTTLAQHSDILTRTHNLKARIPNLWNESRHHENNTPPWLGEEASGKVLRGLYLSYTRKLHSDKEHVTRNPAIRQLEVTFPSGWVPNRLNTYFHPHDGYMAPTHTHPHTRLMDDQITPGGELHWPLAL